MIIEEKFQIGPNPHKLSDTLILYRAECPSFDTNTYCISVDKGLFKVYLGSTPKGTLLGTYQTKAHALTKIIYELECEVQEAFLNIQSLKKEVGEYWSE